MKRRGRKTAPFNLLVLGGCNFYPFGGPTLPYRRGRIVARLTGASHIKFVPERMSANKRIPTDGGPALTNNPFAALSSDGLPAAPENLPAETSVVSAKPEKKNRGRVDIIRQKAGRGGKTVTVVKNFVGIGLPEKEQLAKAMQKACGVGGTVKDGQIEIQGDKREEVARILTEANFRPVFAGG